MPSRAEIAKAGSVEPDLVSTSEGNKRYKLTFEVCFRFTCLIIYSPSFIKWVIQYHLLNVYRASSPFR